MSSEDEKEVLLTEEGYQKLVDELTFLVTKRRKEVAERIKDSIEYGELTENSEYKDAKEEQAFVEGRIQQVNDILAMARIIDEKKVKTSSVCLGSMVTLKDLETGEDFEYHLVGSVEADPSNHRISNESPVGRAIIGKKVGQIVHVNVPQGSVEYQVVSIKKHENNHN